MKGGMKFSHNKKLAAIIIILIIAIGAIAFYANHSKKNGCTEDSCKASGNNAGIANPASVFCESHNGTLTIKTADDGSQAGICTLENGTQCDEWAYFRGECS